MSDEEEADEIVDQVFEEIGLDLNEQVRLLRASSSALCKVPIDLYGYFFSLSAHQTELFGLRPWLGDRKQRRKMTRKPTPC
jgi:hypothetical protein